jgi:hypothetical protein
MEPSGAVLRIVPNAEDRGGSTMSLEQNKAIARRHFDELWTNGDLAVADDIYSPATVGHCGNFPGQTGYPECGR